MLFMRCVSYVHNVYPMKLYNIIIYNIPMKMLKNCIVCTVSFVQNLWMKK